MGKSSRIIISNPKKAYNEIEIYFYAGYCNWGDKNG